MIMKSILLNHETYVGNFIRLRHRLTGDEGKLFPTSTIFFVKSFTRINHSDKLVVLTFDFQEKLFVLHGLPPRMFAKYFKIID